MDTVQTAVEPSSKPKRRRADRSAQRHTSTPAPAFIKRGIPPYEVLGEAGLQRIEATAERILAEVGIELRDDAQAVEHFRRAGAKITDTTTDPNKGKSVRLRFEPQQLRELLQTAPAQFTQYARNPAHNVQIGGDGVVLAPAYGSPFVMDLDRGRRYGTLEDFQNFIKLAYASPWLHHSGGTVCEPTDIPVNKRHLDMVYSHIRYSDKAFMGSVTAENRAEDSIALCQILFGQQRVDEQCVILGNVNVNSPLVWDGTMTKALRAYARHNQAAVIVPFILGGAMGPVTNAGAIAQALAETLVGCALTQLERKGAPVIFGNFLSSMSLRSGSPTFGTPEPAVGSLVVGQLARRLNLPLRCAGSFTTSKLPDAQAMQESVMSMLSAVQCGANFILHSAGFLDGLLSMSYEKFMLDADFCGALHSYLKGVEIDDNNLAFSAYEDVQPGQHFLGSAHTLAHYETAFFDAKLADNEAFENWQEAGAKDAATRANAAWKKTLNEYQPPALDVAVDEELQAFIGERKANMADRWY